MSDQYKHNYFVSYAWADNEKLPGDENGWVSNIVKGLNKFLNRELPREFRGDKYWIDYERGRGNEAIKDFIKREVDASRILVPIVTRSYLDSPWCREELELFIRKHGANSGRVFPVWMDKQPDSLPEGLQEQLGYTFWYLDCKHRIRTRCLPFDPTDREYWDTQQDMAHDMAEKLVALIESGTNTQSHANVVKNRSKKTNATTQHQVLINGGEEDTKLIQEVARELFEQHGIGNIIPLNHVIEADDNSLKSSEINADLRAKLKFCTSVCFVYRNGPIKQIHRQYNEFAKALSKRKDTDDTRLDICCPPSTFLGINHPGMRIHECELDCAKECAESIAREFL